MSSKHADFKERLRASGEMFDEHRFRYIARNFKTAEEYLQFKADYYRTCEALPLLPDDLSEATKTRTLKPAKYKEKNGYYKKSVVHEIVKDINERRKLSGHK